MGFFTFVDANGNSAGNSFTADNKKKGHSELNTSEMFTIGTPLPEGSNVGE
jgi:hypothetical protein